MGVAGSGQRFWIEGLATLERPFDSGWLQSTPSLHGHSQAHRPQVRHWHSHTDRHAGAGSCSVAEVGGGGGVAEAGGAFVHRGEQRGGGEWVAAFGIEREARGYFRAAGVCGGGANSFDVSV